jgi:hypothetical protein
MPDDLCHTINLRLAAFPQPFLRIARMSQKPSKITAACIDEDDLAGKRTELVIL